MDPEFWRDRWLTRQIGFHQSSIHPFLERWWPTLHSAPQGRVYAPLCGKSLDMVWLAVRGHRVVGSELVGAAVEEFFGELGDVPHGEIVGAFRKHSSGSFEIFEGDALALTPEVLGPVQGAYDRAALVALPPEMRQRYVASFARLMPSGSQTLLVAFEYPQHLKAGPPFSVQPDEVQHLYGGEFTVRELERVDILPASPKFAEAGVPALHEVAYALQRT
jgi:thiopurine S-methyltransferase